MATPAFTKMTDAELQGVVQEYQESVQKYQAAQGEINRRRMEAENKEEEEKRKELLASDKFKKLQARFNAAIKRLEDAAGEQKVTFNIPVTFTYGVDFAGTSGDCCEQELSELYSRDGCSAKIGTAEGMSKLQKSMLQRGLDQVVANACEEIYRLFPGCQSDGWSKEQQAALKELNKVMDEASEAEIDYDDLDA